MFNQFFGEEGAKRVSRWAASALFFLSLFLVIKVIADLKKLPRVGDEIYPQSTISVTGDAEVYAVPDIAEFSFTVTELAGTVKQAQDKVNEKINAALSAVRGSGVEDKDIKTTYYSAYPKYEWNQPICTAIYCPSGKSVLVGYEVSQTILVKVRDMDKVADLVTKVGEVSVSSVSDIQFSVDDKDKYIDQAREEAIAEAKTKAKTLAKQLGIKLGKFMYYSDNSDSGCLYGCYGKGGSSEAYDVSEARVMTAELPEGQNKITANISITYEVK